MIEKENTRGPDPLENPSTRMPLGPLLPLALDCWPPQVSPDRGGSQGVIPSRECVPSQGGPSSDLCVARGVWGDWCPQSCAGRCGVVLQQTQAGSRDVAPAWGSRAKGTAEIDTWRAQRAFW